MDKERAAYLLNRYQEGTITSDERDEFVLLLHHPAFEGLRNEMLDSKWSLDGEMDTPQASFATYDRLLASIKAVPRPSSVRRFRKWLPYAAAAILVATAAGWLIFSSQSDQHPSELVHAADVQPGGNKATLTLADGRTIELSETHGGIVVGEGISYLDGTSVIDDESLPEIIDYEISTPRGGTYQVTLPDGTQVWLNAGTVLRYPSRFEKDKRVVELSGEAYFDVEPLLSKQVDNGKVPFLVRTDKQTVEVLGTQFNLSAYPDDHDVRTTLVDGSVRVASVNDAYTPVVLQPGQQSVFAAGTMTISKVEVEPFIAWKDGYFDFLYTPFPEMIVQIARWYDVELVYKGKVPQETFSGRMSRAVSLQSVLKFFEGSKIKTTLSGGKLIIE